MDHTGIVMVYTGDGKGKTTAAMGLALRAAGHGQKVSIVQFLKGLQSGEIDALEKYLPTVYVYRYGTEQFVNADDPSDEDVAAAQAGLARALELMKGDSHILILDEANVAIAYRLIDGRKLKEALEKRPVDMTVVITGRGLSPEIEAVADLISEVKEIRHHWRKGVPAQKGIEH